MPQVLTTSALTTLVGGLTMLMSTAAGAASMVEEGKNIAFDRKKGNCMACHVMDDAKLAGNIGPPLVAMQSRFPDKSELRTQIWDATKKNPDSMMPPFGRHHILTEEEIDKVTEYVYTL